VYWALVRKPAGKRKLEISIRSWQDFIKMDLED
jgi:hypothetical protein